MSLLHTSARVLEFDALRELLRAYASSSLGQNKITALAPSTDAAWISTQQSLATEIREFRRVGGRFDFSALLDITPLVQQSRIAGVALEIADIRDVILVVDRAAEWRQISVDPPAAMRSGWRETRALSARVADFTDFLRAFRNKILPDGTIDDKASPELARIRREIEKQRRAIQDSLRGYLRRLSEGAVVQDELITIRGERFVIPVKIEQKRRVQGVVHGASSSGQTVFVEPLETIEQNNELVRLLEEELAEIHRILLEMTARIGSHADAILIAVDVLSELELQFAKARFAEDYNCVEARLSMIQNEGGSDLEPCGDSRPRLSGRAKLDSESTIEDSASSRATPFSPGEARDLARSSSNAQLEQPSGDFPETHRTLLLHNARHPLLERNLKLKNLSIIPVTIELNGSCRDSRPRLSDQTPGAPFKPAVGLSGDVPADDSDTAGVPHVSPPLRDLGVNETGVPHVSPPLRDLGVNETGMPHVSPSLRDLGVNETGVPHVSPSLRDLGVNETGVPHVSPSLRDVGTNSRQLIITGPNTGGKTVTLKTVGLLALMAQSGLPVPADRAELPIFDAVLADIGDYQSIEQNLSTFSAHVTNIDFISRTATPDSLVLLDELGSATDPEEGAALAVAIATHFNRIGCISIISTHHTSLKVYAANTPGVLNAAVGFDEKTLEPTYDLKVGIPGASAGINIAHRLGLNPEIIDSARSKLTTQSRDVSRFLDKLHADLREAEKERFRLQESREELEKEKSRLAVEGKKDQQTKVRELEKKLETLLRDFEYHAREAVNAIQDRAASQKLSKDSERRIAKARREFREQFDSTVVAHSTGADRNDPHAEQHIVKHVSEGDTVKLKSTGRSARIARKLDDHHFEVEMGALKMKIARDDIAEVLNHASSPAANPVQSARSRGISVSIANENATVPSEINVIGHTVDDASREVEKFLDRAFLAGLPRVRIVHGSGMGILRKALRQMLQHHPHVSTVVEAPQNEGGAGATLVDLRI